ncbi:hypothetical protein Tco_0824567 [Tanacetum coccineum]|uniref:Tf2-1-like SH3-like domain-containing protein n=1 Tax=Tanacetum coccineum TaxID=301880 RepID=A0ABQ5AM13_9ASTR
MSVVSVKVTKLHGYGYLEEVMVRRADRQLYKFKEGDFVNLHLDHIKDMLLLVVQHKLFHLDGEVIVDLAVALRMFTRSLIIKKRVEDVQLGVESYQKSSILPSLKRTIRELLPKNYTHHHINHQEFYNKDMPRRKWYDLDKRRSGIVVDLIDKQMLKRRILRNLERLVGGRELEIDYRLMQRTVAYRLELPQELSRVHHTFHVSNLKKCYADEPLVMPLEGIHVDDKLQFVEEPVEIMEREIKRLKRSRIPLVKVRWNSRRGPEFTWEREDSFKQKYPQLFTNRASSSTTSNHVSAHLQLPTHPSTTDSEPRQELSGSPLIEELREAFHGHRLRIHGLSDIAKASPSSEYIPGPRTTDTQANSSRDFPTESRPFILLIHLLLSPPGYVTESDPERIQGQYEDDETEDGLLTANDEDEDDEDRKRNMSTLSSDRLCYCRPVDEPVFPPEGTSLLYHQPPSTDITNGLGIYHPASGFHIPSTKA